MKLIINTASTFKGGGVQVANSFLKECIRYPENEYHVVLGDMMDKLVERELFPGNFRFYSIGYRPATRVFHVKSRDAFFKNLEREVEPDVVFTTSGPAYWRPEAPHLAGYNLPHYIYRYSPFFKKISLMQRVKWDLKGQVLKYFFKHDCDAWVVQTDDVNKRLRKWFNTEKIYTVSNTCSSDYQNPKQVENKLPEKRAHEFRLLTLSSWYAHKNLEIIPLIVNLLPAELRDRISFIVTLPDETFQANFPEQVRENVINTGPVKPDEGPSLYQECDALFLPSLLECFSASYPEAMAMDKPILTTDMGFARSICKDAALYFKPADPNNAVQKIQTLIDDEKLRNSLILAGKKQLQTFDTPKERAEKYLSICEGLIGKC